MFQDKVLKGMLACHKVGAEWHTCGSQGKVPNDKKGEVYGGAEGAKLAFCKIKCRRARGAEGAKLACRKAVCLGTRVPKAQIELASGSFLRVTGRVHVNTFS
ncbi:unnamed protein product [Prunus armeniaca]